MDKHNVVAARNFLSASGVWPPPVRVDVDGWLNNFDTSDREVAHRLLELFVFYNNDLLRKLVTTAFMRIGSLDLDEENASSHEDRWNDFLSSVVLSYPASVPPNPSDSGHLFVRVIRDHFGISESQLLGPLDLVKRLSVAKKPFPLVFVDDFSGTGNQFVRSLNQPLRVSWWRRKTSIAKQLHRLRPERAFAVFGISSISARREMLRNAHLRVSAGNQLDESASILTPRHNPDEEVERLELMDLVERYSVKAGISAADIFGYKSSGLTVGFEHGIPNNTLPIFTKESATWKPLISKS